jgi:hypothetical protein
MSTSVPVSARKDHGGELTVLLCDLTALQADLPAIEYSLVHRAVSRLSIIGTRGFPVTGISS